MRSVVDGECGGRPVVGIASDEFVRKDEDSRGIKYHLLGE
jgi:hypothetical protein